jgi:hypothetical protein
MTNLSDPKHPIWEIGKALAAVTVLSVILFFSANRFDNTEYEVIGWFTLLYFTIQGGHAGLKKLASKYLGD